MDPSANICLMHDSFHQSLTIPTYNNWYSLSSQQKLTPSYQLVSIQAKPPALFTNQQRYDILQKVKDAFDTEGFIDARNATNPFEYIGRSIFITRAAVKLANIDAVHNVTKDVFTFNNKQSDKEFSFCDVAAGPGGFTQYLQFRYPNSKGYGMTLRHEKLDWSVKFLDMEKFDTFYGSDNSGNLYTNWDEFNRYVRQKEPNGVDLVTADGGFDLEDGMDKTLLHRQEFLSSRLLLTQALVGISCNKVGGNFVLKVFDTVTNLSAQIIYLLSNCYEQIMVFKPVTSRPANAERYILCLNLRDNIGDYRSLMEDAARSYKDDLYLESIFSEDLPEDFVEWLTENNRESIEQQLVYAQNILRYLQGEEIDQERYDVHMFLTIWNLLDTPPKKPNRRRR